MAFYQERRSTRSAPASRCCSRSRSSSRSSTCCARTSSRRTSRATRASCAIDNLAEKVTDPWLLGTLIVLYIGTQLAASVVTAISADTTQRRIMLALPFVFVDLHHQLPGRADRLLDHHQRVDDRPAAPGEKLYPKPAPFESEDEPSDGGPARGKPPPGDPAPAASAAVWEGRRQGEGRDEGHRVERRQRRRGQAAPQPAQEEEALRTAEVAPPWTARPQRAGRTSSPRRSGDSVGEAKWAAMKELEPRFPASPPTA